ncbi:MAG: AAA family ATPase, partial [Bacteroidia bacterium]
MSVELQKIGLQNFRVFSENTPFELRPITLLVGGNNSGKSSLLKALLLLNENAQKNELRNLSFQNGRHHIRKYEQALNDENPGNVNIVFSLAFKDEEKNEDVFEVSFSFFQSVDNEDEGELHGLSFLKNGVEVAWVKKGGAEESIYVDFAYLWEEYLVELNKSSRNWENEEMEKVENDPNYQKQTYPAPVFFENADKLESITAFDERIISFLESISLQSSILNVKNRLLQTRLSDYINQFLSPRIFYCKGKNGIILAKIAEEMELGYQADYKLTDNGIEFFSEIQRVLGIRFASLVSFLKSEITYLAPIHAEPKPYYADADTAFGSILKEYAKRVQQWGKEKEMFQDREVDLNHNKIIDFINRWLKKLEIAENLRLERFYDITSVFIKKGKKEYSLSDMGFGTIQLVPTLMKI